jgi:hypothetical protein
LSSTKKNTSLAQRRAVSANGGWPSLAPPQKTSHEVCLNQRLLKIHLQFLFRRFRPSLLCALASRCRGCRHVPPCRYKNRKSSKPSADRMTLRYGFSRKVGDVESIDRLPPVAINETTKQEAFALIGEGYVPSQPSSQMSALLNTFPFIIGPARLGSARAIGSRETRRRLFLHDDRRPAPDLTLAKPPCNVETKLLPLNDNCCICRGNTVCRTVPYKSKIFRDASTAPLLFSW